MQLSTLENSRRLIDTLRRLLKIKNQIFSIEPYGELAFYVFKMTKEPTTEILGGPDLYIDHGSTINLTCIVLNSPEPPAYIFWNHNDAGYYHWVFDLTIELGQTTFEII
ncbi:hypothetical protein PV325_003780 [Microctonus aethiopoides]|nr:hypothetical protein PV325_003780 [Microctonus aethiopoides]